MIFSARAVHAASLALLAAFVASSSDARACGGCFHAASETESTVVTGHRMAFAVSTTQTVLWDQIQYTGSPSSFAWVLPVKQGAFIELSNDAWFETLDAATSAQVISPPVDCFAQPAASSAECGPGCGAAAKSLDRAHTSDGPPPVTVVHQGTIGPYETVTLHANVPNALPDWLTTNGYAIDPTVSPIIDAYTNEGFDFIALRLLPDKDVQAMKPVRVITPGMTPTLPLRMVSAGTGAHVALTLFVIGEGRWQAQNFPNAQVNGDDLVWDFAADRSNYSETRQKLLAASGGKTWNNAYAKQGALLSPIQEPLLFGPVQYTVDGQPFGTLGEAYVQQGIVDDEADDTSCVDAFKALATSPDEVVDLCDDQGTCASLPSGKLDSRAFACGTLDDMAAALTGMHPRDVWLTRIEADLPRAALATDLTIEAAPAQAPIDNFFQVTKSNADPCSGTFASMVTPGRRSSPSLDRLALFGSIAVAVGSTIARRRRRRAIAH